MLAREGRYKREAEARPLAISDCISLPGQHPHIPGKDINVTDDIYSAQKKCSNSGCAGRGLELRASLPRGVKTKLDECRLRE